MNRHAYAPPPSPDVLRSSRARQVNYNPNTTGDVVRREGVLRVILRGILARWIPLAFGCLLVVGLIIGYNDVLLPWWNNLQNQWHYGDGRITQMDANVGHGGKSHFIAEYYSGKIVIIEVSLDNPANYHTYVLTPLEPTSKNPVIDLSVVRDSHSGKMDLAIQVEGADFELILYNTGNGFSQIGG